MPFKFVSRLLLSATNTNTTAYHAEDVPHEDEHHDVEEAFEEVFFLMIFVSCLWFVGKFVVKFNMPALVGEILVGIILGPNLVNFVPESPALIVIGEIGLVLLVVEAGIDVSIVHLKIVGSRGLMVAVFGSIMPLGIGTGLAYAFGQSIQTSIAIGACLAPTSMGIALNVLRSGQVLNTPVGQLIIAAAVLDDVIALMLLSLLGAMQNPTAKNIILPLIVSPVFIVVFGYSAIKIVPKVIKQIMINVSPKYHEHMILFLLFCCTFILMPICNYAGSSHLLGAFLAGLMFCTDHTVHSAWSNQIKRILQWMLRIFFACTIGFAVPIKDFGSVSIIEGGFLYLVAIIGKLLTGLFATPLNRASFFTIAFSMSAWGEFAFILATASFENGTLDKESYSSVLMAVLISVVVSPLLLHMTLNTIKRHKQNRLTNARDFESDEHPVYFCIHSKGRGRWGHQDRLLKALFQLQLEVIDFRAFHDIEDNHSHHLPTVQDVFYVQDGQLSLPPTVRIDHAQEKKLHERVHEIKHALKQAITEKSAGTKSTVKVMRWLPGVRKKDDTVVELQQKPPPVTYCRREAFRQARAAIDHEEQDRSAKYLSSLSRVHTSLDTLHRNKFNYHGNVHSHHTDDLISLQYMDSALQSIHNALSPIIRSRSGSVHDLHLAVQKPISPLCADELYKKVQEIQVICKRMNIDASTHSGYASLHSNDSVHNKHLQQPQPPQQHYLHSHSISSSNGNDRIPHDDSQPTVPAHSHSAGDDITDSSSSESESKSSVSVVPVMYADEDAQHKPLHLHPDHMDGIAENGQKQYHSAPNIHDLSDSQLVRTQTEHKKPKLVKHKASASHMILKKIFSLGAKKPVARSTSDSIGSEKGNSLRMQRTLQSVARPGISEKPAIRRSRSMHGFDTVRLARMGVRMPLGYGLDESPAKPRVKPVPKVTFLEESDGSDSINENDVGFNANPPDNKTIQAVTGNKRLLIDVGRTQSQDLDKYGDGGVHLEKGSLMNISHTHSFLHLAKINKNQNLNIKKTQTPEVGVKRTSKQYESSLYAASKAGNVFLSELPSNGAEDEDVSEDVPKNEAGTSNSN